MKHALDPILQELSSLSDKVDDLSGRMDDLNDKVDDLDTSDLADISNTVDHINEEMESVQGDMGNITRQVSAVDALSVAVLALSQQVAGLNEQSERIEGMLTAQVSFSCLLNIRATVFMKTGGRPRVGSTGLRAKFSRGFGPSRSHPSHLLIRDGSPTRPPALLHA